MAQNLCKSCEKPIGAVELIRRQKVTDTDWLEEHYHESCWFELNQPDEFYVNGEKIPKELPF